MSARHTTHVNTGKFNRCVERSPFTPQCVLVDGTHRLPAASAVGVSFDSPQQIPPLSLPGGRCGFARGVRASGFFFDEFRTAASQREGNKNRLSANHQRGVAEAPTTAARNAAGNSMTMNSTSRGRAGTKPRALRIAVPNSFHLQETEVRPDDLQRVHAWTSTAHASELPGHLAALRPSRDASNPHHQRPRPKGSARSLQALARPLTATRGHLSLSVDGRTQSTAAPCGFAVRTLAGANSGPSRRVRRVGATPDAGNRAIHSTSPRAISDRNFLISARTLRAAHSLSDSISHLSEASARRVGDALAASKARPGAGLQALQKGDQVQAVHGFTFVPIQLVVQLVGPLNFFREAALEEHPMQREFPLMQRLDAPAIVPTAIMRTIKTYREACRVCRQLSPRRKLSWMLLAEEAGLIAQHCTDYFNSDDAAKRRDLPFDRIDAVERVYGNTAISQFRAAGAKLTVIEQMQADATLDQRRAAA